MYAPRLRSAIMPLPPLALITPLSPHTLEPCLIRDPDFTHVAITGSRSLMTPHMNVHVHQTP